jgi:hypothetical protein
VHFLPPPPHILSHMDDPITPLLTRLFETIVAGTAVHDDDMEIVNAHLQTPASKDAFFANNGAELTLRFLEAAPNNGSVAAMLLAVLLAAVVNPTVEALPSLELKRRCIAVATHCLDAFLDHECIVFAAMTVWVYVLRHSLKHETGALLPAEPRILGIIMHTMRHYHAKCDKTHPMQVFTGYTLLLAVLALTKMDPGVLAATDVGVISQLTFVARACIADTATENGACMKTLLGGVLSAARRFGTEVAMQQFVDAGGVETLVASGRLHADGLPCYSDMVQMVMATETGRKAIIAAGGIGDVVSAIGRAEDEARVMDAFAPLFYQTAEPHSDVLEAISAAGGAAVMKAILETHPEDSLVSVVACYFLMKCEIPHDIHDDCYALMSRVTSTREFGFGVSLASE